MGLGPPGWGGPGSCLGGATQSSDLLPFLRQEDSVPLQGNFHVWAFGQTFAKKLHPTGPSAPGPPSGWFMGV